jgi:hypothetical protein
MDAQQDAWNRKARRALTSVCPGCSGAANRAVPTPFFLREEPEYSLAEAADGPNEPTSAPIRPKAARRRPVQLLASGVRFTEAEWPVSFSDGR